MTTPTFISGALGFGNIRYYTQFDPYFFSTDNRPLTDIATNVSIVANAADAGRRSSLIDGIGTATDSLIRFGAVRYIQGLALSNPSSNVLRVGPGIDYEPIAVSASDSRTVMKRGIYPFTADFPVPAPGAGNSVIYLVQGRYVDFGSTSPLTTSNYPNWDATNAYLPTSLVNGELQISVLTGVTAVSGTEVAPAPSAGWFPIYNVTVVGTGTTFTVLYNVSAPVVPAMTFRITNFSNIGSATTVAVADTPASSLAHSATNGVIFSVALNVANLNPYKPIKFSLGYSPATAANVVALRVKYQAIGVADAVNPASYTTNTQDNLTITGAVDSYNLFTTINGTIAASVIQAAIAAGKTRFTVAIERLGSDGADTNTGVFRLIDVSAIQ